LSCDPKAQGRERFSYFGAEANTDRIIYGSERSWPNSKRELVFEFNEISCPEIFFETYLLT
jgi:hypothetical protein